MKQEFDFTDLFERENERLTRSEADEVMRIAIAGFEATKRGGCRKSPREIATEALARSTKPIILGRFAF